MADKQERENRRGCFSFFLTIFILLAAGGAVFYFGWVQFKLDAGEYGVIYTKTSGWEDKTIENGKFTWRWQGLIPTNLTVHVIKPELRSVKLDRTGILPSGKMYGTLLGGNEDFGWTLRAKVTYIFNPDALPALLSTGKLEGNPDPFYADFEAQLQEIVTRLMAKASSYTNPGQLKDDLSSEISSLDDNFIVKTIAVTEFQYPDTELYNQAKQLSGTFIQERQKILAEIEELRIRRNDVEETKIESLSKIGKVITDYPKLLELNPDMLERYILGGQL